MRQGPCHRGPGGRWQESGRDPEHHGARHGQGCDMGGHRITASECTRDLSRELEQPRSAQEALLEAAHLW